MKRKSLRIFSETLFWLIIFFYNFVFRFTWMRKVSIELKLTHDGRCICIVRNCSRLYLFIWTSLWETNLYFTLNEILVGIVLNIWTYLNIWYYLFSLFRYLISHLCLVVVTTSSGQNWLASLLNIVDSIPNLEQEPANPTYHSSIVHIYYVIRANLPHTSLHIP